MVDLLNENVLTLSQAARTLPGGSIHISTIHRWRLRGVRGIRLETAMRGGKRVTSHEALQRFFDRLSGEENKAICCQPNPPKQPVVEAESFCSQHGI
jgi:hypothetical protein